MSNPQVPDRPPAPPDGASRRQAPSPVVLIVLGAILLLAGAAGFFERGFFANKLLGARVLGNTPWDRPDAEKVKTVTTGAGVIGLAGALLALTGAGMATSITPPPPPAQRPEADKA